ncbi:unnamed protein product [Camellia sinensis]
MIHRGLLPSLVGISHVAIQFPAYEKIKSYFAKRDNTTTSKLSPGKLVIASAISKLVASVMTYPHEEFTKKGIMVFALHEELDLTELVGDFKVHIQITKETFNGIPARLFPIHNRQHHHQN